MPLTRWNESVFRFMYSRAVATRAPDIAQYFECDRIDLVANAQRNPNMKVQIPASPSTEVAVKTILPEDFPAIDKAAFANVHPASFVLTNQSDRAIVALAIEWSYTAQDGHEGQQFYKIDNLSIKNAKRWFRRIQDCLLDRTWPCPNP